MKLYPILTVIISMLCLVLAQESRYNINRYRVAVLDFSVTNLNSEEVNPSLGQAIAEIFNPPLVKSKRFTVVTRADLHKVLEEIGLGATGIITPEQVQQLGELSGAEIVLTGSIIVHDEDHYNITANFIDVSTGELTVSITSKAESSLDFQPLSEYFVAEILKDYPRQGRIISVSEDEIFIDLGEKTGLLEENANGIIYHVRDINGIPFEEEIASFEIAELSGFASRIHLTELKEDATVRENDLVEITSESFTPTQNIQKDTFEPILIVDRPHDVLFAQEYIASSDDNTDPSRLNNITTLIADAVESISSPVIASAPSTPAAMPPVPPAPMIASEFPPAPMALPVIAPPTDMIGFSDVIAASIIDAYIFTNENFQHTTMTPDTQTMLYEQLNKSFMQAPASQQDIMTKMPAIYARVQEDWDTLSEYERHLFKVGIAFLIDKTEGAELAQEMGIACEDFACYYQNGFWHYPNP